MTPSRVTLRPHTGLALRSFREDDTLTLDFSRTDGKPIDTDPPPQAAAAPPPMPTRRSLRPTRLHRHVLPLLLPLQALPRPLPRLRAILRRLPRPPRPDGDAGDAAGSLAAACP